MSLVKRNLTNVLIGFCLVGFLLGYLRYEPARDTANKVERIVTHSDCKEDPTGAACQQIFVNAFRAFDEHTACVLARKLHLECVRQEPEQPRSPDKSNGGDPNGPDPQEPTPGSAPSDAPDPPVSGPSSSGGDGGGSSQGGGSDQTGPVAPPPPPTEPPPSPDPPPQSQAPGLLDPVTDPICQTTTQLGLPVCL